MRQISSSQRCTYGIEDPVTIGRGTAQSFGPYDNELFENAQAFFREKPSLVRWGRVDFDNGDDSLRGEQILPYL